MQHEDCETSWRTEGFRVIDRSDYIACCSVEDHRCWNQSEEDPPACSSYIEVPLEGLDLVLGHAIIGPDFDYSTSQTMAGGRRLADMRVVMGLVAAGADINKSMWVLSVYAINLDTVTGTVWLNIAQQLQLVLSLGLFMHLLSLSELVMAAVMCMLMLVAKDRWQIPCHNSNHHHYCCYIHYHYHYPI